MNCRLLRVVPCLPISSPESSPFISINELSGPLFRLDITVVSASTSSIFKILSKICLPFLFEAFSDNRETRTFASALPKPRNPVLPRSRISTSTSFLLASSCIRPTSIASSTDRPVVSTVSSF